MVVPTATYCCSVSQLAVPSIRTSKLQHAPSRLRSRLPMIVFLPSSHLSIDSLLAVAFVEVVGAAQMNVQCAANGHAEHDRIENEEWRVANDRHAVIPYCRALSSPFPILNSQFSIRRLPSQTKPVPTIP